MKKLSEQIAKLSVRAKEAEDAAAAAEKEAHDKIAARREKARVAAAAALEKVQQNLKSTGDSAARNWETVKAKVADDVKAMKAKVAHAKHERDVKRAETHAELLEWEATFAIDYAISSIEQATAATLDAIDGRIAADEAKLAS